LFRSVYSPTSNFTAKAVAINGPTGCSRVVTQYVQVYPLVNAGQVGPSQTICPGDTPAELVQTVAPSGGSGTYSFYWMESSVSASGPWTIIPGAQSANFQPGVHTQSKWYRRSAESLPCAAGVSNVVEVKVNPNPTVSSSLTAAICSGNAVNYTPTSAAPGTSFAWSSSVISGGVTGNGSGSGPITDVLSLPVGQTASGLVEYTITPTGTAPSFCPGVASVVAVNVDPVPSITNTVTSQEVCSGQPTDQVDFSSDVAGTAFSWSAVASSGIIQFPESGSGSIASFVPINTTLAEGVVTFTVVPAGPLPTSCSGSPFTFTITVRPAPTVTNPVMEQTVCSGDASDPVVFQTNVPGTSFTWTATPSSGAITGFTASGTGNIPAQTLHNSGTVQGLVIYHIVPDASGGGCPGAARDYTIHVNPLPVMTSQVTAATCSGSLFNYTITTGVAGSSFAWSRGTTAGISNAPSSGTTSSISESLINTTNASVTVVYQISVTGPGPDFCPGPHQELHVTVRPLPLVNAGTDLTIAYGTATTLSGSATVETGPAAPVWTPAAFIASGAATYNPATTNLYNQQEFTLEVTDGAGCVNNDKMWVFLSGTPLEAQATAAPLQICAGQSVQLTGSATGGSGTYGFSWSPTTGLSDPTSQTPLATPAVTTTYTLTVNDGFNSDQAQVTITVIPNPVPYAVSGGGEICQGAAGVQVTLAGSETTSQYHLELNGSPVSGAGKYGTGGPLTWDDLADGGTYTVLAITNINNCATAMTGSALLQVNPLPTPFTVTGGGSYQLGGTGLPVGLSSSQPGMVYELELLGTGVVAPSPLVGNGSPLSFGLQTAEGIYQITATDYSLPTQCSNLMSGVAVILVNPNPTVMSVTGGGVFCEGNPGVVVGLDSTETGINYSLRLDGVATGLTMPGTGSAISFGEMTEGGTYTVMAQNVATGASIMMNGVAVVTVLSSPVAYTLIPTGDQCPGTELFLNGSESGVLYILRRDGNPVDTLTGVGGMGLLGFGPLHQPGIYDVVGAHPSACSRPMTGTINITTPPAMFGVIPAGILCPENEVLLSGSEVGVNYQLRRNGTINTGMPVAGTGSLLNFGSLALPGIYTVVAINPVTLCEVTMADSASLFAAPEVFSLNPQGDTCGPVELTLGGSQLGYTYHLYRDLAVPSVLSIAGTGAPVSFGEQVLTGTYTVKAVCDTTLCVSPMSGSVTLHAAPQLFNVTPSGLVCPGQVVGLDGSEPGVFYQLILNGSVLVGGEVSGTGSALNFGAQFLPGVYTVEAHYPGLGCSALMNSSATVTELPTAFGITPQGEHCAGVEAGLSGSETGVTYYLIRNAMVSTPVNVVAGTGLPLSFGSLPLAGTYTVTAFDDATGCEVAMTGQLVLNPNPVVYNLVPAGLVCEPAAVSLSGTQPGVNYSLYNNGVLAATLTGTGGSAGFGLQPAGVYTALAVNSNSCEAAMNGTVTITGQPVVSLPSTAEICAGDPVELSPVVTLGTSPQWTTSGDGFFADPTALNTFYFPGTADTASGNVTLTLHVSGLSACAATTATASVAVAIAPNPGVDAGTDQLLCVTDQALLSATAWHCSSTLWSTTGDGTFVDASSTITTYLPGPADLATGSALLVINGTGNGVCSLLTDADTLLLTFAPLPVAEAGVDQTLCADTNALLIGTATNGNTVAWSTSGSGYFTPAAALNTVYHPSESDRNAGTVWLKLTVTGASPCLMAVASDSLLLTIQPAPVVSAGPDVVACITQTAVPVLATATHATAPLWTTTGDGTFANPHATATQYLPGGGDLAAGLVNLVFSASGTATCSLLTVSDSMVVSFSPLPQVDAGADATTCASGSYMLSGGATGVSSVQWSSTGDGIFNNSSLLNATYFPGPSDSLTGSAILTLTGFGAGSCSLQMATDDMLLNLAPVPVVNAGTDLASCHTTQVQLDGEAFDYQSVMWSSGGGGIFSNASTLNPLFTPSLASAQTGSVKLYLRAFGTGLCSGVVATDSVVVTLDPLPVAFAGPDIMGCGHSPDTVTLATAQHHSTLQWSTTGDGLLLHSTTLSPVYIPGNNDIAAGQAELTLTVAGVATCALHSASDEALVLLYPQPVASAGADISVCSGSSVQLNGTAQYFTAVEWSSTGDGTFSAINTLSPVYQPGAADLVAGQVQLILGAQGQSQCLNAWDYDTLLLTLDPLPVAEAGDPLLTCINNPIELNGITQNSSSVLWSTAGDGQFADATMPQTLYTPGLADVAAGQVQLTLTAWGDLMCSSQSAADQTLLTMAPLPTVDAGDDGAVCTGDFFQCQATATNVQGVVWSTTGDGTFSNNQVLNPLYQPGMLDRTTGHVTLIVTATGEMPCGAYHDSDTLTLSISPLPTGFITGTSTICQGQTAQVQVLLTGTAPWSITWSNSVSSTTVNNIVASPYQFDVAPTATSGYYLTAVSDARCSATQISGMAVVTVNPQPQPYALFAVGNGEFCEGTDGAEIRLSGSQTGVVYQLWFGSVTMGFPVVGTGLPLSFGMHSLPGNYTATATSFGTGCVETMTGVVTLSAIPSPEVAFTADTVCLGTATQFTLQVANPLDVVSYTWNFGDGQSVTYTSPENPSHEYAIPGEFNVELTAVNTVGCTTTFMFPVRVMPAADPWFWWNGTACAASVVEFENFSVVAAPAYITGWHWNFGDGHDTTILWPQNPNVGHVYANAGQYDVTLTVTTSNGCQSAETRLLTIKPRPVANFAASGSCQNMAVQFTDLTQQAGAGNIEQWSWSFGDPASGTANFSVLQNPEHVYAAPGSFEVLLEVFTNNGCSDTAIRMVDVLPAPVAAFTADTVCVGQPTQFSDQSVASAGAIVQWLWNFGDGSLPVGDQNPLHTFAFGGMYVVSLTVTTSDGCQNTTLQPVEVLALPSAVFTASTANCESNPVTFDDQSVTTTGYINQWHWDFGDGAQTTVSLPDNPDVEHLYPGSGQFLATLTVTTAQGCEAQVSHLVQVNGAPMANFSVPDNNCLAVPVPFTDQSQAAGNGALVSWEWNFGEPASGTANTSVLQNPMHQYLTEGTYDVLLVVHNNSGCADTIVKQVVVVPAPAAAFTADTVCLGSATTFTDQSSGGALPITSWLWNFGDGTTSVLQNPVHTYAGSGSYIVNLQIATQGGCTDDTSMLVVVNPVPVAAFSSSGSCSGMA
ncbi:MAG: PKD domain-containing protein, partial [Bacteroidales bacterium]|nr:PKD domain-containing protein [Bacteroidales bacterium]